jgi:lipid II:glycine glycyltransferase (peptidoglycan interpeptide bridge formation enzyme)
MQWTEGVPTDQWDQPLFAAGGHFLQSSHWAAFQSALGRQVFYAYGPSWQCLAIVEKSKTGTRLYCPYGPLAKSTKSLAETLQALRELAKQHNAVFVRCEPIAKVREMKLYEFGLKPALKDIQPRLTWVQDLNRPHDDLLADMTATNRNLWRNHATKGLKLRASRQPQDVQFFIDFMREVASHNHILQHPDHYYQAMVGTLLPRGAGKIYLTEHNGKPIAAAICFDSPVTRYYAHAAAHFDARKLHPGTPLVAQMMFDAKEQGQKQFDFVGVAPADAPSTHRWAGLTKFKKSFGGEYKPYLGTWELPVKSLQYGVYRAAYRVHKALR